MLFKKIRKIVAVLRGQVSPALAGLAVGLGFWFGLMPGFYGIHAFLLVLLVLLNLPVGMFILSVGIGKAASLAAAPLLYHLGLKVMDHANWLLDIARHIPVVAITDFGRPALVGAILAGPVGGLVLGSVMGFSVLGFRKTWLKLQGKSEKFEAWQNKGWVRLLDRIVVGKRPQRCRESIVGKDQAPTDRWRHPGGDPAALLRAGRHFPEGRDPHQNGRSTDPGQWGHGGPGSIESLAPDG